MRSKSNELQDLGLAISINHHQVGFDVAIPVVFPVSHECVVIIPIRQ